jgi:hypothetical protein
VKTYLTQLNLIISMLFSIANVAAGNNRNDLTQEMLRLYQAGD